MNRATIALTRCRFPLCERAAAILNEMAKLRLPDFVFPGLRHARPLSNMAMSKVLKRMGRQSVTVHGFRSTFRDWAAEQTSRVNNLRLRAHHLK